jgi:hypothetical protein
MGLAERLLAGGHDAILDLPALTLYPATGNGTAQLIACAIGVDHRALTFAGETVAVRTHDDSACQKKYIAVQCARVAKSGAVVLLVDGACLSELESPMTYQSAVLELAKEAASSRLITLKRRVIVINDAGLLSRSVQHALHKVVECTAASALFVFVCRQPNAVDASLVSRGIVVNCAPLEPRNPGAEPEGDSELRAGLDAFVQSSVALVAGRTTKTALRAHSKNHRLLMSKLASKNASAAASVAAWLASASALSDDAEFARGVVAGMASADAAEARLRQSGCHSHACRALAVRHFLASVAEHARASFLRGDKL